MVKATAITDSNQSWSQKIEIKLTSVKPIIEAIETIDVNRITVKKIAKATTNSSGL